MLLTVFTPTHNRIKLIPRLYESLLSQEKDFEWLVVDDGSSDGTDQLIASFQQENKISIRYIRKDWGGKHTAFNVAIREAKGDFLICIDSDDRLAEDAVKNIRNAVHELQPDDIGFVGYKAILNRELLIHKFQDNIHRGLYSHYRSCGANGEFSLVFRVELLRQYRFPEPLGEPYVAETVVFDRMEMDGYTLCPIHKIFEICEYQDDGLSYNAIDYLLRSPTSQAISYVQRIDLVETNKERIGYIIRYHAFNSMIKKKIPYTGKHKVLVKLLSFSGIPAALYYKNKWEQWKKHSGKEG